MISINLLNFLEPVWSQTKLDNWLRLPPWFCKPNAHFQTESKKMSHLSVQLEKIQVFVR